MKISNKISLFILFLLAVLCANTIIGLSQLKKISYELNNVIEEDIVLTDVITSINGHQFEKAILFERVIRIAEEIGFESITYNRKQYLLNHVNWIKQGFDGLCKQNADEISKGIIIVNKSISKSYNAQKLKSMKYVKALLLNISERNIKYNELADEFLKIVNAGDHKVSFEDIENIEISERSISKELKKLLEEIKEFIRTSADISASEQLFARKILWISFYISLIVSMIIAFAIIKSIVNPLKILVKAANQVGLGDFEINLDDASKDEIGDLSKAFNIMAQRLSELTSELENKNELLTVTLEITEEQKVTLEKINKELDRFVHTVSHDIKAPLTGIAGYASVLKQKYFDVVDDKGKRCIDGVGRSADRINNLIEDLLELTKINRVKNPYEKVDIAKLLNEVLGRLEFNIEKFKVQIDLGQNFPEIICDRIKLTEVFYNLISNAIKFSSKNAVGSLRIGIGFYDLGDSFRFYVKDNGIGIAPQNQKDIFEIFKRLHNASEYEGTGAGLAIVKDVINEHGGNVWVESTVGQGATFYFTIPKDLRNKDE